MRIVLLLTIIAVGMISQLNNEKAPAQPPPFPRKFYTELKTLFQQYYPQITANNLPDKVHFEYNTRLFMIHEPLKTGEWQDAFEERGPQKGGILCDISLIKGKYAGAAVVPQTFDKRYFNLLVMAPYSATNDSHLYVHLLFPKDVNSEFLKQFMETINSYGSASEAMPPALLSIGR